MNSAPLNQTKKSDPSHTHPRNTTSEHPPDRPPPGHTTHQPHNLDHTHPYATTLPEGPRMPSARSIAKLWSWQHGYSDAVWMPCGCLVALVVTVVGEAQLKRCGWTEEEGVHETWSYPAPLAAWAALEVWESLGFEGEPQGWVRHQPSNRRRQWGDPATEEVRP